MQKTIKISKRRHKVKNVNRKNELFSRFLLAYFSLFSLFHTTFFLNFKKLETKTHVHREPPPSFRHKFGQIILCGIKKVWRNKVVFFGTCPTSIGPMVWTKYDLKTNCLRKMPSEELCQQEHLSVLLCLSPPQLHSLTPQFLFSLSATSNSSATFPWTSIASSSCLCRRAPVSVAANGCFFILQLMLCVFMCGVFFIEMIVVACCCWLVSWLNGKCPAFYV